MKLFARSATADNLGKPERVSRGALASSRPALVAALVLAIAAGGSAHLYLERLEAEIAGGAKVKVLGLGSDLPPGSRLSEASLVEREVPAAYVLERQVLASDLDDVLGARLQNALSSGDALLWTALPGMARSARSLASLVAGGMRAIHVSAGAASFDGLLRPGDRVDLLYTDSLSGGAGTSTLLQNLLVLAVGADVGLVGSEPGKAPRRRSDSLSLSVTAEQAQLVTQAEISGRLRISLRNPGDTRLTDSLDRAGTDALRAARARMDWRRPAPAKQGTIDHVR